MGVKLGKEQLEMERTVTDRIRAHLESAAFPEPMPSLESLRSSEWCDEFEELMRNRLVMGAFRYGLFSDEEKWKYRCVDSIRHRLDLFEQDENLEHLVDCANLCLVEFVGGQRRGLKVLAQDDVVHVSRED